MTPRPFFGTRKKKSEIAIEDTTKQSGERAWGAASYFYIPVKSKPYEFYRYVLDQGSPNYLGSVLPHSRPLPHPDFRQYPHYR